MSDSEADLAIAKASVANPALEIINKLMEVVKIQQDALEEINRDHYDHVMAPVVAMNTLEKSKQLLEGE